MLCMCNMEDRNAEKEPCACGVTRRPCETGILKGLLRGEPAEGTKRLGSDYVMTGIR
jgi:hypothetical protein